MIFTPNMTKLKAIFQQEKYMDDAVSAIFSNISETMKRREEMSIWGPIYLPATRKSRSGDTSTVGSMQENLHSKEMINQTAEGEKSISSSNRYSNQQMKASIKEDNRKTNKIPDHISQSTSAKDKKRAMSESESEKTESSPKLQACNQKPNKNSRKEFHDWCRKRNEEFEEVKSSVKEQPVLILPTFFNSSPCLSNAKEKVNTRKNPSSSKDDSAVKSSDNRHVAAENYESPLLGCSLPNMMKKKPHVKKQDSSFTAKRLTKTSWKESDNLQFLKEKSRLCIKITDKKDDKSFELMSDFEDISKIKRIYPNLQSVIPNVDSASNELPYCASAVNVVFRFLFNSTFNFNVLTSPLLGVEVLAAARGWGIDSCYKMIEKDYLEKALNPSNLNSVFFHAQHFGLKEICDICKNINPDIDQNHLSYDINQKACIVTVSVNEEPLEICFPFHPSPTSFTLSFDRYIQNKVTFKVTSGCYIITGFQIQLNESLKEKGNSKENMLEIHYCTKNVNTNNGIESQKAEKPLRPVIIIYFKEKNLVVNAGEIGEITVDMYTKPYLCSSSPESKMRNKGRSPSGKFNLTVESDFKIPHTDNKLFIIGKLFYHVKT